MKLVRFPDLRERFGVTFTRQHLGRLIKAGRWPAPIRLGVRSVAFVEQEIIDHLAAAAAARPAPATAGA